MEPRGPNPARTGCFWPYPASKLASVERVFALCFKPSPPGPIPGSFIQGSARPNKEGEGSGSAYYFGPTSQGTRKPLSVRVAPVQAVQHATGSTDSRGACRPG